MPNAKKRTGNAGIRADIRKPMAAINEPYNQIGI